MKWIRVRAGQVVARRPVNLTCDMIGQGDFAVGVRFGGVVDL